jgi:hypothetical protein
MAPRPRLRRAHVGGVALAIGLAFAIVTQSSSKGHDDQRVAEAVRRGADRLLSMQRPDGTWSRELTGPGDLASSGRAARALLEAHVVTRQASYLAGATRAARAIVARLGEGRVATSPGNLIFLADYARATDQPGLMDTTERAWRERLAPGEIDDGRLAARRLLARANPTDWTDGAWHNWMLGRAGEEAELARLVGHGAWAEQFLIEAATTWAPKNDHAFWASAAGSMLEALSTSTSPEAARIREVDAWLLESNALLGGVPWNDTPYDTYAYAGETASALQGLLAHERITDSHSDIDAVALLVARQSSRGGWGAVLSLVDEVAERGGDGLAPADMAEGETAEIDALVVGVLSRAATHGSLRLSG